MYIFFTISDAKQLSTSNYLTPVLLSVSITRLGLFCWGLFSAFWIVLLLDWSKKSFLLTISRIMVN